MSCTSSCVNPLLYIKLVGILLYIRTIHDLPSPLQSCHLFSQFSHESHQRVGKQILRYIKDTTNFGFQYTLGASQLVGFTGSNWVGSVDDQTSTSSFVYHLGFSPISQSYKKQSMIALSYVEHEYCDAILCQSRGPLDLISNDRVWI